MSIFIRSTYETDNAPDANNGLVSAVSGRILVQTDSSSQISVRAEGDIGNSHVVISTFAFKWKRGIVP
jgi:hypothetical protein